MPMKSANYTQKTVHQDVATGQVIVLDLHLSVFICIQIMKLIENITSLQLVIIQRIFLK